MGEIIERDGITLDVEQCLESIGEIDREIIETRAKFDRLVFQRYAVAKLVSVIAPHHANRVPDPPWYAQKSPRRGHTLGG